MIFNGDEHFIFAMVPCAVVELRADYGSVQVVVVILCTVSCVISPWHVKSSMDQEEKLQLSDLNREGNLMRGIDSATFSVDV